MALDENVATIVNGARHYLQPRVLQAVGVSLLIASAIFWAVTNRESLLIVGCAMSLIGIGSYKQAVNNLSESLAQRGNGR